MKFELAIIAHLPAPTRLGIFFLALLVAWLPFAIPIYLLGHDDANLVTILTVVILAVEFLFLLRFWTQKVYQIPHWLIHYGLGFTRQNGIDLLRGLSIGLILTLSLFFLEAISGWLEIKPASTFLVRIIAEGLLSGLGIALFEELVFRGWLLNELQRDYSFQIALWASALIFACLHFLKPLEEIIRTFPQFPALVLLGLILVWAKRSRSQRLGICIGIHGGLVWGYYIFKVGQLLQYTNKVPTWITGIDDNPMASGMGLLFLGILAFCMRKSAV